MPDLSGLPSLSSLQPSVTPSALPVVGATEVSVATTEQLIQSIQDPLGIYCVLEVCDADDRNPLYHVFPVMPESLSMAQSYLQTITPTLDGVYVDDFGEAPSPIVLQGTFGRFPRLLNIPGLYQRLTGLTAIPGPGAPIMLGGLPQSQLLPNATLQQSTLASLTGYKLAKLMSELVDHAHRPDTKGRARKAKFYNFAFARFYEVTVDRFDAQMAVQQNNLWVYSLTMTAIRPLAGFASSVKTVELLQALSASAANDAKAATSVSTPHLPASIAGALSILGKIDNSVNTVVRTVTRLSPGSAIGYAAGTLDGVLNFPTGTTQQFLDYATQAPNWVLAVANVVNQATRRLPADTVRDINSARGLLGTVQASIKTATTLPALPSLTLRGSSQYRVTASSTTPVPQADASIVALSEIALNLQHALDGIDVSLASVGLTLSDAVPTEATSVVAVASGAGPLLDATPTINGAQQLIIRQGDTLAQLAQRFYNDPEQWPLLSQANAAVFNDLLLPAPDEDLSDYMGAVLTVPTIATFTDPQGDGFVLDASVGARALGTDLSHTLSTVTRTDGTTDLAVLDPLNTLLEGLWHRLSTPLGAVPDVPAYGSRVPALIGESFGALTDAMTSARAAEALSADGRLTSVTNVQATRVGDTAQIQFSASVVNQGQLGTVSATLSTNS